MPREFPLATVLTARDAASPTLQRVSATAQRIGTRFQQLGRSWTAAVSAPVGVLGFSVGRNVVKFETEMNRVGAITRAAGAEFASLEAKARELGSSTQFSASQAAAGMGFLAQAGFTTDEILAAIPSTLSLAAAGQFELSEASDLASNVLSTFGMAAKETARVSDILAHVASSSNTSVLQLGDALKFAGPVATSAGVSLAETTSIIGALSDAGNAGEMAGTALRGAIVSLLKPSTEAQRALMRLGLTKRDVLDDQGRMTSFVSVLEKLNAAGATTEDVFTIFGQRPGSGVAALLTQLRTQGADVLRNRTTATDLESGGRAAEMAERQTQGLSGSLKSLASRFEELQLAIGDAGFTRVAKSVVDSLGRLFEAAAKIPAPILGTAAAIAGAAAAVGPLLLGLGTLIKLKAVAATGFIALKVATLAATGGLIAFARRAAVGALIHLNALAMGAVRLAGVFTSAVLPAVVRVSMAMMANPVGLVIAGIAGLIAAGVALYKNWDVVVEKLRSAWSWIKDIFGDGVAWITQKLDALGLGRVMRFLGFDGGSSAATAAADFDTTSTTQAVGFQPAQNGRAAVTIDVRSGREDVRVRATQIDDVELQLNQGIALGAIG